MESSPEIIVENGGDIFFHASSRKEVLLLAESSPQGVENRGGAYFVSDRDLHFIGNTRAFDQLQTPTPL